jgi:mRNA interferase RelE/StbE
VEVLFKKSFEKDLGSLRDKPLLERIRVVIEEVENATEPGEINNLKKLKSEVSYYRIRVGDYRLGISIDRNTVTFVRALHRKDIYRYFP